MRIVKRAALAIACVLLLVAGYQWVRMQQNLQPAVVGEALPQPLPSLDGEASAAWTTPRTYTAHETLTASILNTHVRDNFLIVKTPIADDGTLLQFRSARKSSTQTITSSTTLADCTGMTIAILASETWTFQFTVYGTAPTAGDWKFAVTAPAAITSIVYGVEGAITVPDVYFTTTAGNTILVDATDPTKGQVIIIRGTVVNGVNAGSIQLQFAQGTSNGTGNSVLINSSGVAQRVG